MSEKLELEPPTEEQNRILNLIYGSVDPKAHFHDFNKEVLRKLTGPDAERIFGELPFTRDRTTGRSPEIDAYLTYGVVGGLFAHETSPNGRYEIFNENLMRLERLRAERSGFRSDQILFLKGIGERVASGDFSR